jgi:carboxyl-terminal processing protease
MKPHRLFAIFCAALLLTASCARAQQPTTKTTPATALATPDARDRQIVEYVASLIGEAHLTRHKLDNEISTRMHRLFLEGWDPRKLFFLQADIDEFAASATKHAKFIASADLSFAVRVYERFVQRVAERNEWAQALAAEKFDFTQEDSIVLDRKSTTYCKDIDEAKARWRSWIKYELCGMIVDGTKEDEARSRIQKRYRNLLNVTKQLDRDELLEHYLAALASSYDPHTTYMSPRSVEEFQIAMRLQLQGIGALLGNEDGRTLIKEIIPGGAAALDKRLKVGDQITGVGEGENGEMVDVSEMSLSHTVRLIRGESGTRVRLEVMPANSAQRSVYVLTRRKVELTERGAKGDIIEGPAGPDGVKTRVGVIKLPSFYGGSGAPGTGVSADVRKILAEFKQKGVDSVVLDLRNNGGGLLNEAISLASLFVDEGPIVQVKDYNGKVERHQDNFPGVAYDGPLVVVINRLSASASEIFAGVIKDYKRGLVVGDSSTFGKGSVAQMVDLGRVAAGSGGASDAKLGALQITLQAFYRVNGESTQKRGVKADVVLPSATDREEFSEAKLDHVLEFERIAAAEFTTANLVSADTVTKVRDASVERRAKSEDFAKLQKRLALLRELVARKTITFTEASLRQQKAARKELGELPVDDGLNTSPDEKKNERRFGETAYEREVLAITADFGRLGKQR